MAVQPHKVLSSKNPCIFIVLLLASIASNVFAFPYNYTGVVTLCTGTCDSFASLDVGSTLTGTMDINTTPGSSFDDADMGPFQFIVFNPALPISGPVGDPLTDNPLVLDSTLGAAASNGTVGTTDAAGEIISGQMLIEFLVPPFSENGVFTVFDLVTGDGQICLFYATAGCIPGATVAVIFEGGFTAIDSDSDSWVDVLDNCPDDPNPFQEDFDNDGVGYACDSTCATNMDFVHTFLSGDMFDLQASGSITYEGVIAGGADITFDATQGVVLKSGTSIGLGGPFTIMTTGCVP